MKEYEPGPEDYVPAPNGDTVRAGERVVQAPSGDNLPPVGGDVVQAPSGDNISAADAAAAAAGANPGK